MVMKYIILANSNDKTFNIPRQLVKINGERLIERTIRLLKENGVSDIIITASDKRFDGLGAERYEPTNSNYDYATGKGYWLNAFPFELMNEPICFIWGDVYFSEEAIKTIVNTETDSMLFFCTYNNTSPLYIKHHDEPLAYKIRDTELFKEHVDKVKRLYDEGKTCRHPIVWEVYRSINGIDVNEHIMTKGFVAINDISCDIDTIDDIESLKRKLGGIEMIKVEALQEFTLARFNEIENIERVRRSEEGKIFTGDKFECEKELCDYLLGANPLGKVVVKVIEVEPEMPTIIGHRTGNVEYVIPLDNENMKKLSKAIEKRINENGLTVEGLGIKKEIKPKKKKSSKK